MKRAVAAVAVALAVALGTAGCQSGYPHACDNHGGTIWVLKGLNGCRDGTRVGDGWLWLHHRTVGP